MNNTMSFDIFSQTYKKIIEDEIKNQLHIINNKLFNHSYVLNSNQQSSKKNNPLTDNVHHLDNTPHASIMSSFSNPAKKLEIENLLSRYMCGGKMWRSLLMLYYLRLYGGEELFLTHFKKYLVLATSLEFLQAFLLIHDDVMDNDEMRRNSPSIHMSFRQHLFEVNNAAHDNNMSDNVRVNSKRVGGNTSAHEDNMQGDEKIIHDSNSLAICLGDVLYSYTIEMVAEYAHIKHIIKDYAHYISIVGVGQLKDVYWSSIAQTHQISSHHISTQNILDMYMQKTGVYTFILPALLGLYVYGECRRTEGTALQDEDIAREKQLLIELGNVMGVLFQVQDDVLGLRYNASNTGKPLASDLQEKKQTYVWAMLQSHIEAQGHEYMQEILTLEFGDREIQKILSYMNEQKLWDIIDVLLNEYELHAKAIIAKLQLSDSAKFELSAFVDMIRNRKK